MMTMEKAMKMHDKLLSKAKHLAQRPYQIDIKREPGELASDLPRYTALVKEMPYCVAQGFTEEEAQEEIRSTLIDYILSLLDRNMQVPEPEENSALVNQIMPLSQ